MGWESVKSGSEVEAHSPFWVYAQKHKSQIKLNEIDWKNGTFFTHKTNLFGWLFFFHCVCEWQWLGQIFWLILCECLTFNWLRYFKGCLIDWKAFYVQTRLVTLMLGIEFTVTAQVLWALAQGFLTNVDEFIDCLCSHWFMEFWHWSEEIATSFSLVFFQHFSFIFSLAGMNSCVALCSIPPATFSNIKYSISISYFI